MAKKKRKPTSDAVEILHRRYYEGHPERLASLEEERANLDIACRIYDLRDKAGLTQKELAKLVGDHTIGNQPPRRRRLRRPLAFDAPTRRCRAR